MTPAAHEPVDFILSSGFLAFGRQAGFLDAMTERGVRPARLFGTSSGALVGALFCAGLQPSEILAEVTTHRPLAWMALSWTPWSGVFTLDPLVRHLESLLPQTFAELPIPLHVGVRRADGSFAFVGTGPLAPAVAASCAMPGVFRGVTLEWSGQPEVCADGGAVDRLGLAAWRACPDRSPHAVVHLVERTAGAVGQPDFSSTTLVRSGRSGAHFWSLGDVAGRAAATYAATLAVLDRAATDHPGDFPPKAPV